MSRHVSTAVLQRLGAFGRSHAVQYTPTATQTCTSARSCSPAAAAAALCDTATAAAVHGPTAAHGSLAGGAAHMASEIHATSAACGVSPPQPHAMSAPATSAPATSAQAACQALLPLVFTRGARTQPKLPVILATRLEGVGEPGDVVRVAAGYARNLLIPYRLAYPATESYISAIKTAKEEGLLDSTTTDTGAAAEPQQQQQEQQAAAAELTLEQKVKEAEEVARRLETLKLSIKRNVARRSSELREPIELAEIMSEVRRQFSIELAPANVQLQEPLKAIGAFEIPLRFPSQVPLPGGKEQIALRVNVRRK